MSKNYPTTAMPCLLSRTSVALSLMLAAYAACSAVMAKETPAPRLKTTAPGTFVAAHYYREDLHSAFHVELLDDIEFDLTSSDYVDFADRSMVMSEINDVKSVLDSTARLAKYVLDYTEDAHKPVEDRKTKENLAYIRWVDNRMQWGLFAAREIHEGEPIGIYTGVVRIADDDQHSWQYDPFTPILDANEDEADIVVDAGFGGNELRFVNHARGDGANLSFATVWLHERWYSVYFATRHIPAHQQLLVSYGKEWEKQIEDVVRERPRAHEIDVDLDSIRVVEEDLS